MRAKIILTILFSVALVPAAFCWEYTFDTGQWSYFDGDTGASVAVTPSDGVLSVDYPDYGFHSVRYIFADKDSTGPVFGSNKDLTGGYVSATLSYSASAPTYAYFFLAGAGEPGDDQIYVTEGSWTGGTQTFWTSSNIIDAIGPDPQTIEVPFESSLWSMINVGPVHDDQRGDGASWEDSLMGVDAVGLMLGYVGTPPEGAQLNIDEFTVTPEPSILLLSGPLAGFLGWRIRRRGKRTARKA